MKLLFAVIALAANATIASADTKVCQDFSGTWVARCMEPAGDLSMTVQHIDCDSILINDETIITDGKTREVGEENKYTASWNEAGTQMKILIETKAFGLDMNMDLSLVQDDQGTQSIVRKMTLIFAGESEVRDTCVFQRK